MLREKVTGEPGDPPLRSRPRPHLALGSLLWCRPSLCEANCYTGYAHYSKRNYWWWAEEREREWETIDNRTSDEAIFRMFLKTFFFCLVESLNPPEVDWFDGQAEGHRGGKYLIVLGMKWTPRWKKTSPLYSCFLLLLLFNRRNIQMHKWISKQGSQGWTQDMPNKFKKFRRQDVIIYEIIMEKSWRVAWSFSFLFLSIFYNGRFE